MHLKIATFNLSLIKTITNKKNSAKALLHITWKNKTVVQPGADVRINNPIIYLSPVTSKSGGAPSKIYERNLITMFSLVFHTNLIQYSN